MLCPPFCWCRCFTWATSLWFSRSQVSLMAAFLSNLLAICSSFSCLISSSLRTRSRSCSALSRRSQACKQMIGGVMKVWRVKQQHDTLSSVLWSHPQRLQRSSSATEHIGGAFKDATCLLILMSKTLQVTGLYFIFHFFKIYGFYRAVDWTVVQ